ncbi:MAG: hypothetical protein NZ585_03275 [Chloracidobacterium sp.]|nr:hypothetical protein [Chloracidobacterium sp.]
MNERGSRSDDDALMLAAIVIGLPLCGVVCACAAVLGTTPPTPDALRYNRRVLVCASQRASTFGYVAPGRLCTRWWRAASAGQRGRF